MPFISIQLLVRDIPVFLRLILVKRTVSMGFLEQGSGQSRCLPILPSSDNLSLSALLYVDNYLLSTSPPAGHGCCTMVFLRPPYASYPVAMLTTRIMTTPHFTSMERERTRDSHHTVLPAWWTCRRQSQANTPSSASAPPTIVLARPSHRSATCQLAPSP